MTWKFLIMLYHALLDLLTIQSSRYDGNTAYKHSDEFVIFTLFSLGECPIVTQQECTNSNMRS
jgi:hypothetical protein